MMDYLWSDALYFEVVKAILVLYFTAFGVGCVAAVVLSIVKGKLGV